MDQDLTQIDVAALTDAKQLRLATGRVLPRHKAKPRCKVSPLANGYSEPTKQKSRSSSRCCISGPQCLAMPLIISSHIHTWPFLRTTFSLEAKERIGESSEAYA
jgi:hypothetical protein